MKILQVHNFYRKRGGEDTVVDEEKNILEKNGHTVLRYFRDNAELENYTRLDLLKLIPELRASTKAKKDLEEVIAKEKPDVCHVHNVFSLITPVVYKVCQQFRIPVVQTLHNFRLLCTNSMFFRNGHICEECLGRTPFHSLKYKCYRDSYVQTALLADTIQHHRGRSTWTEDIDAYICLSEFAKNKFISGGLPEKKIYIKPNFIEQPKGKVAYGDFFLFVGRIEAAKGLSDLVEIAKRSTGSKFVAIGNCDDPSVFSEIENLELPGVKSREEVLNYIRNCKALIFPSVWYEGMPMVIIEAFSLRKSVIARDIGAMSTMISHEKNGLKYNNMEEFIGSINRMETEQALGERLGEGAYKEYEEKYSPEQGYKNLIEIYSNVLDQKNG